jgi:hypothetical protein
VTYLYEDPDDATKVTGTVESPEWTEEDRAALLGLQAYEDTLCPGGCGQPRQIAWHADAQALCDVNQYVCTACTARDGHQRVYTQPYFADEPGAPVKLADLSPLRLGVNTIEPSEGG